MRHEFLHALDETDHSPRTQRIGDALQIALKLTSSMKLRRRCFSSSAPA